MILIGSSAIKHHYPNFPRDPKDVDYVVAPGTGHERVEGVEFLQNPVLWEYYNQPKDDIVCGANEIYTMKMAHLSWDINWDKHMYDVQYLRNQGCYCIDELFDGMYEFYTELHGKNKRSDLKMSAEDFFDNAIKFPVKHDDLHEILITYPWFDGQRCPTYQKILTGEVEVSEKLFNMLSEIEKSLLVMEEVMVMAMERYSNYDYRHAYARMLKKCIISHFPIWEAKWAITNFIRLERAPFDFIKYLKGEISIYGNSRDKQIA